MPKYQCKDCGTVWYGWGEGVERLIKRADKTNINMLPRLSSIKFAAQSKREVIIN